MTYNEPMPWMKHAEDCDWHLDQYEWECTCRNEPEPESRSLTSCRVEAVMMAFALLCVSPVIAPALALDLFTDDRALWRDANDTIDMLRAMWRGEMEGFEW
jgi:hypothetical protein